MRRDPTSQSVLRRDASAVLFEQVICSQWPPRGNG